MLGGGLSKLLRNALPTSQLPQSILDDVDEPHLKEGSEGEGQLHIGYSVRTHSAVVTETAAELIDREMRIARDALDIAKGLGVTFDADPGAKDAWSAALNADDPLVGQFATVAAVLAVARRLGMPVFSDDRWIRVVARQEGLASFGTLALLDALPAKMLSDEARGASRKSLLEAGAWGMRPTVEDLSDSAAGAGWSVTPAVRAALEDSAAWANDRVSTWRLAVELLSRVHEADAGKLAAWVEYVLDSAKETMPPVRAFQRITSLLLTAWQIGIQPPTYSNAFFQALVRHTRRLPARLAPPPGTDIPLDVVDAILALTESQSDEDRMAMFLYMIRRLGPFDLANAWLRFVR